MAYPTTPVTFTLVNTGENPSAVANLIGSELVAIETALLHASAQTQAPVRMRQGGNLLEWGPAAVGLLSVLGANNGKDFIGLGAEAGSVAGKYTTRGNAGIVLTGDGLGGVQIWSVPAVGVANQTPVLLFTVTKDGIPQTAVPVACICSGAATNCPTSGTVANHLWTAVNDVYGFYTADAVGNFKVPVGFQGTYLVVVNVSWAGNATGTRGVLIVFTGGSSVTDQIPDWRLCDPGGGVFSHQVVMLRHLIEGDQFRVQVVQSTGGALSTTGAAVRILKLT